MFTGYSRAVERFEAAAKKRDPQETFIPVFEALNWAVALDDRVRVHWVPEGEPLGWAWRERVSGAELMGGVRWARNRAHHQWSDALALDEAGRRYPRDYPVVYFEWLWRPANDLPTKKKPDHAGQRGSRWGEATDSRCPAQACGGGACVRC
jgi:hypothetical protein